VNKFDGGYAQIDATLVYYQSPGQIECYWKFLRHPHWHVAVIIHTSAGDILIDPRMPYISVDVVTGLLDERFPGVLRQRVSRSIHLGDPPWAGITPGTCVTIAKALLGIRAWWVLTPYQLFRYVEKRFCK
jgi:hypothetical protein